MAQRNPRKRTLSRASTASIHSVATQPNPDQSALMHQHGAFTDQWAPNEHGMPRDMPQAIQPMPAGDMMLRPASRMQAVQPFPMNPNMQSAVGSTMPYHQHPGLHHAVQAESFNGNASFTDGDSQMMDRDEGDEVDSLAGRPAGSKPPSGRTSANNEIEMRVLFHSNKDRTLADVAKELHGNERGPNSERARQIFAMLWISQVCSKGKGSVPRGRVYANYASRCATERITVLNPASFGKLVRVLFPGLKTRRLGVRGESKYHYTEFSLMDDTLELREPPVQLAPPLAESAPFAQSFSAPQSQSPALNGNYSALPSPTIMQQSDTQTGSRSTSTRTSSIYNQPNVTDIDLLHSSNSKTALHLAFLDDFESTSSQAGPLVFPNIEPFLPNGTDPDAAKSLTALYRSHCTSLVECIRYCKEKSFFHLYTSFQGTLTMPVQKLFSHPSIAPWIEECDFILYQRMMQIIAHLILQVVPKPILDSFRNISERLVSHIRESFQGQPRHVVQAKEAPAAIFAGLLDRGLRVNLTAHAAANMLSNSANRDQMYLEWLAMVRIRKVAECVPTRGMDDLVDLLLSDIRGLIDPVNIPWEIECQTIYSDVALRGNRTSQVSNSASRSPESILDHWVTFLQSLPGRFPYATPTDIVWCVERVGSEIMRDITLAQGKSFGSWWVTKCWLDEMIAFLAEYGGFLTSKHCRRPQANPPKPLATENDVSQESSRAASGSEDLSVPRIPQPQPDRAPFPTHLDSNGQDPLQSGTNPDDSGIGIRTPEEEFPMGKFDFQASHDQSLQSLEL
ncbi:RFX DNA-binding domain-containing protein [Hypomontagnella monticulosa]|nr:RFX DNA-binding domain-containing protein [Hypomontagnella monticulosa]